MGLKQQNGAPTDFESQLIAFSNTAVKVGKLLLARAALKLVGEAEYEEQAAIPQQPTAIENCALPEQTPLSILDRCTAAFQVATGKQAHSTDAVYIKFATTEAVPSEYIAIAAGRYLYRPALDAEATSDHPYWLSIETIGSDVESGLPTIYYRDIKIDALGNLLAQDHLPNGQSVLRDLDPAEAIPINQLLHKPFALQIVPFARSANT